MPRTFRLYVTALSTVRDGPLSAYARFQADGDGEAWREQHWSPAGGGGDPVLFSSPSDREDLIEISYQIPANEHLHDDGRHPGPRTSDHAALV